LREHPDGCSLAVRVQPGAKKTEITGIYSEGDAAAVKIAVQAPPVDGRANEVLIGYLAKVVGLTRSSVSILRGESGRTKLVLLGGIRLSQAHERLTKILED
jgi:hypothetical protein